MTNKTIRLAAAISMAVASASAYADATFDSAAAWSAGASQDFRIDIPGFVYFRVGTDISGHINQLIFTATTANVGNSVPIAGTGGDATASGLNVVLRANVGQITITETNNSGGNGLGTGVAADGFIPYTQITTSSSDGGLPAPSLSNAGGNTSTPLLSGSKITNRTAVWTFGYANTTVPSAGTYGAGGGTGGRVTYTATAP